MSLYDLHDTLPFSLRFSGSVKTKRCVQRKRNGKFYLRATVPRLRMRTPRHKYALIRLASTLTGRKDTLIRLESTVTGRKHTLIRLESTLNE